MARASDETREFEQVVAKTDTNDPRFASTIVRALATTLSGLPSDSGLGARELLRFRHYVDALAQGPGEAQAATASDVKAAFAEAIEALKRARCGLDAGARARWELGRAQAHARTIVRDQPIAAQADAVHATAVSLSRFLVLLSGDQPKLPPRAAPNTALASIASAERDSLQRLRSLVHSLSESGWGEAPKHAADTLRVVADTLEAASGRDARVLRSANELRFELERFEMAATLYRMQPLEAALQSATNGIEHLQRARGVERLSPWVDNARAAVERIRPTSFQFERPVVQDAFRCISAALFVTLEANAAENRAASVAALPLPQGHSASAR